MLLYPLATIAILSQFFLSILPWICIYLKRVLLHLVCMSECNVLPIIGRQCLKQGFYTCLVACVFFFLFDKPKIILNWAQRVPYNVSIITIKKWTSPNDAENHSQDRHLIISSNRIISKDEFLKMTTFLSIATKPNDSVPY